MNFKAYLDTQPLNWSNEHMSRISISPIAPKPRARIPREVPPPTPVKLNGGNGNVKDTLPLWNRRTKNKPRILDLFCCAGGVAMGYSRAGFDIVGVDIDSQPRFPFEFIQADALTLDMEFLKSFDAIHASPPCQSYSDLAKRNGNAHEWPRLVEPVREMLTASGKPFVIENVEGAPLINPTVLCGTMFKGLRVIRHRLFETNFPLTAPPHGKHPICHTFDKRKSQYGKTDEMIDFVSVTGGGNCTVRAASDAMGIDWMTKNELNESIPPVYTEHIGKQLMSYILGVKK